jgi:phosphatidylcholine synthase
MTAVFIDSTDGTLARTVGVKAVLPEFNGRKLDDIVDFLTFSFLPSLALVAFNMLPVGWELIAVVPLMASGYGFCQEQAKTEDAFVGFPSYWNILVLYLYVLESSPATCAATMIIFSALVFVPIHYLYPTRTQFMQVPTIALGGIWALLMIIVAWQLGAPWTKTATLISLVYPFYYVVISLIHHKRTHQLDQGVNSH